MTYILTFLIFITSMFNMFVKRYYKWIPVIFIFWLWILYWGNTGTLDYYNYQTNYNLNIENTDVGYYFLKNIGILFGMQYNTFLAMISLICLIMINKTVTKYVRNTSYVFLLYFIYPFMLDVVQVRNFVIMSIFIYAIPLLLTERRKDKFVYIFLILLASSIQITALIYLPLVLIGKLQKKSVFKLISFFFIIFLIMISFNNNLLNTLGAVTATLTEDSRLESFLEVRTEYGFLILWITQLFSFILMLISKKIFNNNNIFEEKKMEEKFILLVYGISIYAFTFLPFYVFNFTFSRFMRNLTVLYYIVFAIVNKSFPKRSNYKFLYDCLIIMFTLILFYTQILLPYKIEIVIPIFEKNMLF